MGSFDLSIPNVSLAQTITVRHLADVQYTPSENHNDLEVNFISSPRFGNLAVIPSKSKISSAASQTLFDDSFAVQGPKLWNAIPDHLNVIEDPELFKDQLTKFMLFLPDKTPIRGTLHPTQIF